MKQFLLKTWLIVVCLLCGVGTMWGADVTYTVTSKSAVSTSGTAPSGSSATFANTYSTKDQLTKNNTMTLTLSGFAGQKITGITLSMHSNASAGAGYLSAKAGSTTLASIGSSSSGVAFNNASWNGSYTTSYTNVTPTMSNSNYAIQDGENIVIVIGATTNSLFCQSFKISYQDAGAPTLSSIAVKTAPTKTTYVEGEKFDPTGLVITKTLSNATTADVAYSGNEGSFTFNPSLETELSNETSVTITYGKKTTTQAITVNPFAATAGTYTINTNNGLYGVSTGNNGTEQSTTKSGITIVSGCKSSATSKTYYDTDHIRYYTDSYLKLTAPASFVITKVVFTANGTWNSGPNCNSNGSYDNSTKTWEGSTTQLDLTFSDQNRIKSIAVTYATSDGPAAPTLQSIAVSGTPTKTTYTEGDIFAPAGLTVTATYSDDSTEEITEGITWNVTPAGGLTEGTTSVSVTATVGTLTSEAYTVNGLTVNAIPEKTIAEFIAAEGGKCYLTGIVSNIANTTYGNFDLTDESGTIYVYGCLTADKQSGKFSTLDVVEGDKIKVLADAYELYNEKEEAKDVIFVEEIAIEKPKYTVTIETPENGTLVVKEGENVLESGAQVEEGKTLTIACTPTDAENYRFKNWQYKEDGDWVTMTKTMTRVVTQDISIRANFELIPTYTINWSVNGAIVKTDENVKQGAVLTAPEVSAINGKSFTGWVTTSTVDADATPSYATISTAAADVTYYAVFAEGDGEGTPSLTKITDVNQVEAGTYAIISYEQSYYLSNSKATNTPSLSTVIKKEDVITIENDMMWTLGINDDGSYTLKSNASTEEEMLYLWGAPTNDGVRIVTSSTKSNPFNTWELKSTSDYGFVLCHKIDNTTYRYLSTYGTNDWRNYTSTSATNHAANIYKYSSGSSYSDFTTIPEVTFTSAGTINFVANDGEGNYYATFSSDKITAFPTEPSNDVALYVESVYINGDGTITKYDFEDDYSSVNEDMDKVIVPANTGVLLHAFTTEDVAPSVSYEYTNAESEISEYDSEFNMLQPCTETAIFKAESDGNYYYKLAYGDNTNKTKLGFWWGADDGSGNFKVKAGCAVLVVPQSAGSNLRGFRFEGEGTTTAIESINNAEVAGEIFNLQGQRMSRIQKGVNIINGKKVLR